MRLEDQVCSLLRIKTKSRSQSETGSHDLAKKGGRLKTELTLSEYWRIIRRLETARNRLDRAIKALVDLGPDGVEDLIPPESLVKKLEKRTK